MFQKKFKRYKKNIDKIQNLFSLKVKLSFDVYSLLARAIIHEAGGHGVFGDGGWHPNDCGKNDPRYEGYTSDLNIMKGGNVSAKYSFPREQNPNMLKFLKVDLEIIKDFYSKSKVKDNFRLRYFRSLNIYRRSLYYNKNKKNVRKRKF